MIGLLVEKLIDISVSVAVIIPDYFSKAAIEISQKQIKSRDAIFIFLLYQQQLASRVSQGAYI